MGWGSKRREPFTPQPAHKALAVAAEEVEELDVTPASEPQVADDDERHPVGAATIGATLRIQGELTGHEDVTIDGSVEGRVEVLDHTLTIGPSASVKASIRGRCVVIEGQVVGDVTADDKVEITATGSLVGDIRAARVVLAENARFKGSIDMGWSEAAAEPFAITAKSEKPRRPVKEERPAATPKATAPTPRAGSLSALNWDDPPPPPLATSPKDDES